MLYYLFEYLESLDFPGARVGSYISFRSAGAVITSLIISLLIGKRIIRFLQVRQIGEVVRELGLEGQYSKTGTPSMGGIIILASIIIPTLLFAKLDNVYVILMLITTVWLGLIGFLDDYIKIFKKNKAGLKGRFKIFGQIMLGLIVGVVLFFSEDVIIMEKVDFRELSARERTEFLEPTATADMTVQGEIAMESKSTKTTIPFIKDNEFDYSWLVPFRHEGVKEILTWVVFVVIVIFIVSAVSNGANLTDGLDGLATGVSAITGAALGILAYVSSNMIYADYLNIMFIPGSEELVIFAASFIGATIGFLWYNSFPAQVFMGDTGSLSLGGIIAVYSYDWLENLFGLRIHSADSIVPDWQRLEVGDMVYSDNERKSGWIVVEVVPDEALVMKTADMKAGRAMSRSEGLGFEFQWTFALRASPTGGTRLLVRERVAYGRRLARVVMAPVGLVSFVMTRKMLLGIRQRVERTTRLRPSPRNSEPTSRRAQ
jgi:phospho-N-acetylmuramoyl-pentapeptide-transferase